MVLRYCGRASATVTVGETTTRLAGGACQRDANSLSVGFGTVRLGFPHASTGDLLTVDVGGDSTGTNDHPAPVDGTYPLASFNLTLAGRTYIADLGNGKATLTSGRMAGSFMLTADASPSRHHPEAITGSFTC
jgi:hypothetical protein